jgi:hypothetical protein
LRQIDWSPDASQLYIQTVEGNPPKEKLHHYIVGSEGGALQPAEGEPEWALEYWAFKSDRAAPGVPTLEIDAKSTFEHVQVGTGSAGAAASSPEGTRAGGGTVMSSENVDRAAQRQTQQVWTFTLLDETIAEFRDTRPIPGLTFSWGPRGSGSIAFTDVQGRLMFLDQAKHKHVVPNVKEATLPAWSQDGTRIAYAVKEGRKKYQLVWCTITR